MKPDAELDEPTAEHWRDVARDYRLESQVAGLAMLHSAHQAAQCDLTAATMAGASADDLRAVRERASAIKAAADKAALPFQEIAVRIIETDELTGEQRDIAQRIADHPAAVARDLMEPLINFLRESASLQHITSG